MRIDKAVRRRDTVSRGYNGPCSGHLEVFGARRRWRPPAPKTRPTSRIGSTTRNCCGGWEYGPRPAGEPRTDYSPTALQQPRSYPQTLIDVRRRRASTRTASPYLAHTRQHGAFNASCWDGPETAAAARYLPAECRGGSRLDWGAPFWSEPEGRQLELQIKLRAWPVHDPFWPRVPFGGP